MFSIEHLISSILFFSSRISVGSFLQFLSFCQIHFVHVSGFCCIVSVFSCSSLSFLKTVILHSLSNKPEISMSLCSVPDHHSWYHVSLIHHVLLNFCVAVFTFEVAIISPSLYQLTLKKKYLLSATRNSEAFSELLWICLLGVSCSVL